MLIEIALWLPICLVLVSFAEYAAHRWFMHLCVLDRWWFPHAILHHGHYYRTFDHEPDPVGRQLNLRITWSDTLLACALASPLSLLSPVGYGVLFVLALLHRWTWNAIHAEMHLAEGRWFTRTPGVARVYWALCRWHFLHHRHVNRNFNVTLPLFDWLLGTSAMATRADREAWTQLKSSC